MKMALFSSLLFCTLMYTTSAYKNIYFLDENLPRLVHMQPLENTKCSVFGDEKIIQEILEKVPADSKIVKLDSQKMNGIINACNRMEITQFSRRVEFDDIIPRSIIFPGTKWCGAGSAASHYDDLGLYKETDMCCRDHDHCPDVIHTGVTKHGLTNKLIGTVSHCGCDDIFYDCLKDQNSKVANKLGKLFFDVLGQPCFKLEYPIKSCLKAGGIGGNQCLDYELDYTQEKIYQFFDPTLYNTPKTQ